MECRGRSWLCHKGLFTVGADADPPLLGGDFDSLLALVQGTLEAVGTPVLIPEHYVPDIPLRMSLYRRLAELREASDIDAFGAELIDRFGPLPEEADHLLKIVYIKGLCLKANVEKLDAGPKGAVIAFRDKTFANPAELVKWIGDQSSLAKIRPDHSVFVQRDWDTADKRLRGAAVIMTRLAAMAGGK